MYCFLIQKLIVPVSNIIYIQREFRKKIFCKYLVYQQYEQMQMFLKVKPVFFLRKLLL